MRVTCGLGTTSDWCDVVGLHKRVHLSLVKELSRIRVQHMRANLVYWDGSDYPKLLHSQSGVPQSADWSVLLRN